MPDTAEVRRDRVDTDSTDLHSYEVFQSYQHTAWELTDIDWSSFRSDLVTPMLVRFAKGAVMGESNSVAAQHGFFNEFVDDYDFSAFVALWGYQELQHHLVFKKWLRTAGYDVGYEQINAMRPPYPPGVTPAATLATNIISEIVTNHMYKCVGRNVQEPVLRSIVRKASGDEARHAREFIHYTARRLRQRPQERRSVLEVLYIYVASSSYQHPVSKFKGNLPELVGHETIDVVFDYFRELDDGTEWERVCQQLFASFEEFADRPLRKLGDLRRAIGALDD
jgi:hypothetical protein